MLHLLDGYDGSTAARLALLDGIETHLVELLATRGGGDRDVVSLAEEEVRSAPTRTIRFDADGTATVHAASRTYQAGRFEVLRLADLREQASRRRANARLRLFVLDGTSPATDIGTLQATAPPGSLFQVASQFNCLESPGAFVVPVADYFSDPTQGPRASISAFPGTLVRHYAAPALDGSRFVQVTDGPQLNLLQGVCAPGLATVRNGYLRSSYIEDPRAFARVLADRHDEIRVGVHNGVEVVLGYDWGGAVPGAPGRTIAQLFTSTVAGGMYGDLDARDSITQAICRHLQRAAYLGTLMAAAALGKERVILTLIGGGVFANPIRLIWETILWAADQIIPFLHRDLLVVVNGRNLGSELPRSELRQAARARGGELLLFERAGTTIADA